MQNPGRRSIEFGTTGDSPQLWELDGRALAGFVGSAGTFINGLMASTRFQPAEYQNLIFTSPFGRLGAHRRLAKSFKI